VDLGAIQTSYILAMGGWMLLLTLLSALATIMVGFLGSRTAAGIARDLRHDVFRTVEGFSFVELDTFSTASLITRSTNDITQIQMVTIMGLRMIFYAPIIGIGGVVRALSKASSMWWIIALAVSVLLAIIASVFIIALPKFKSIQALIDKLNLVVRENLSGMMVIRAFTMQDREASRFDKANKDLTGTMLFVTRVMVVLMPVIMLIMNLVSLLIIWVGAREVAQSQIRIGDMMAFMQYSMQIFFAFLMLSMMFIILPRASISADRVHEVLKTKPGIVDPENPESLPERCTGRVEFKNVGFRYAGSAEKVLSDISFIAEPGKTTAIIGTTGAGKSTLVSLIPRFYDVTEGSVTIDGVDVRSLRQKDLRDHIGFVPQKTSLFSGTIESNLRYAKKDASTEEIEAALEISQAKEFVDKNPEGIRAEISQGGGNVSGGQRQRLTIARALVKKASINIFDDSFSALDFTTDSKLRKALALRVKDSTVILVTQRVASIKGADQILVLDEGTMVGKGTHGELMDTCEVYRDIALSQLRQEELA
jgi:ATP-binding cassette subfamily B protein